VRNSLLLAPMPTASTSQILGNNECFEPYTSNIYVRRVLSGEFTVSLGQHGRPLGGHPFSIVAEISPMAVAASMCLTISISALGHHT